MAQPFVSSVGLPTFAGTSGSVSRFMQDFETFAFLQNFDGAKQASLLPLCLSGVARDAYDCLPHESKKSVKAAFIGLQKAFPSRGVIEAQVQLRAVKFDPNSDLDSFVIRLRGLVATAFPGSDGEGLLFNYFLQSLPIQYQTKLVSDGVTSFEPAVAVIRNMCCAARLSGAQAAPVRQVSSENEVLHRRVEELEGQLARLAQGTRGPFGGAKTCFCCGRRGHVRRDCRHKQAVCYRCGVVGHLSCACRAAGSGNPQWAPGTVPPAGPGHQLRGASGLPPPLQPPPAISQLTAPGPAQPPSRAPTPGWTPR